MSQPSGGSSFTPYPSNVAAELVYLEGQMVSIIARRQLDNPKHALRAAYNVVGFGFSQIAADGDPTTPQLTSLGQEEVRSHLKLAASDPRSISWGPLVWTVLQVVIPIILGQLGGGQPTPAPKTAAAPESTEQMGRRVK